MKHLIAAVFRRLARLRSGHVLLIGLGWTGVVGLADHFAPDQLSFTLLYLLAVAFVAWGGGRWPSLAVAAVAAAVVEAANWGSRRSSHFDAVVVTDIILRFGVYALFGWVTAGLRLLTRHLESVVQERTAQLRAEVEQHRQTTAESKRKHLLYRTLFELSPDGILLEDRDGNILEANRAICEVTGYSLDEVLHANVRSLVPEREQTTVEAHLAQLRSGLSLEHEVRNVRRTGETCFMLLHEKPIELPEGQGAVLVVARDITERKKAETELQEIRAGLEQRVRERTGELEVTNAALRESEARLRLALDASSAGTWSWDVATNNLTWDDRVHELYGLAPDQARCAETWLASIHPEDRDRLVGRVHTLITARDEDLWDEEFRVVGPRTGTRWIAGLGRVDRDAGGAAVRLTGLNLDITERKHAEEELRRLNDTLEQRVSERTTALRESEERFRMLSEATFEGVVLSRDYRILDCNEQACAILGYPREALVGMHLLDFFDGEVNGQLSRNVEEGREVAFEQEVLCGGGIRRTIEIRGRSPQGPGSVRLTTMRDVSDRRRARVFLEEQRNLAIQLSSISDMPEALTCLLTTATKLGQIDSGGFYLMDHASGSLHLAAHRGLSPAFVEQVRVYPAGHPRVQIVLQGQPAYLLPQELVTGGDAAKEGLLVAAIIPLIHEGRAIGALQMGSHQSADIPMQTRITLETIALQTAGAIARIRAESALKESEQRLRTVITGAPIFLFAADGAGTITFEAGRALSGIGLNPAGVVGRKVEEVYASYPAVIDNMHRALRGEEFFSTVDLGSVAVDCWYSPTRDAAQNIAGYIGVATNVTERLRLERQILEVADREQARIGQDLHDGLCQQLVSLAFDACALEDQLAAQTRPEAALAKRIADFLDQSITEARQLSRGLFPIRLQAEGLYSALEELARSTTLRFQIPCIFHPRASFLTPSNSMAIHLYRIAQEAVTNAARHGRPHHLVIAIETVGNALQLRIEDDGVGFSPGSSGPSRGMGLHIMAYRARTIGGRLEIERKPAGGTVVRCWLPAPVAP